MSTQQTTAPDESAERVYQSVVDTVEVAAIDRYDGGNPAISTREAAHDVLRREMEDADVERPYAFLAGFFIFSANGPHPGYVDLDYDESNPIEVLIAMAATAVTGDVLDRGNI
jgi:hypothetical protein